MLDLIKDFSELWNSIAWPPIEKFPDLLSYD